MTQALRFAATAILSTPIVGQDELATRAADPSFLIARTPAAAARIWYWRLTEGERALCIKVVVGPWAEPAYEALPSYDGPQIAYAPKRGWIGIVTSHSEQPASDAKMADIVGIIAQGPPQQLNQQDQSA